VPDRSLRMAPIRASALTAGVGATTPPRARARNNSNPSGFGAAFVSFLASYFSVYGQNGALQCPPVVVAVRKFVASTPICKSIRPQPLPSRLAAVFALVLMGNIPPGMLKEHFDKFSPQWILAVHISLPVVAALRKATRLPPYAILVTVAGSVLGQIVGGRLEREAMALQPESNPHMLTASVGQAATTAMFGRGAESTPMSSFSPELIAPWAVVAAATMWKHVSNPWEPGADSV
jgi:hypothetical protein